MFFDVHFYETELLGPPTPVPGLSQYGNAAEQVGRGESLEKFEIIDVCPAELVDLVGELREV